jgi:hypothetical protein
MDELPDQVNAQLQALRDELSELEESTDWRAREALHGSRQLRSIADRIVLSAKRLQAFVKENTFSR